MDKSLFLTVKRTERNTLLLSFGNWVGIICVAHHKNPPISFFANHDSPIGWNVTRFFPAKHQLLNLKQSSRNIFVRLIKNHSVATVFNDLSLYLWDDSCRALILVWWRAAAKFKGWCSSSRNVQCDLLATLAKNKTLNNWKNYLDLKTIETAYNT